VTLYRTNVRPVSPGSRASRPWWRDAVIYQVYIRSFADGDGDGVGDIEGVRLRLPYLRELGVDAIWLNPWYRSPMVDGGYDVADYRDIDPSFGTLQAAEDLIADCHHHGLRVIVDLVPNHTSERHAWFQAALAAAPGSAERARYWFRPGRGAQGSEPPNDWRSSFGGSAWTQVPDGEFYLHLFAPQQPDLNWSNADVRAEFDAILRFWLDRGVDGFRIDVAHGLAKDPALPDLPLGGPHPHWDRDEVHEIYRGWRRVIDAYDGQRKFVAEAWLTDVHRLARYLRPGELHTAFNFDFLTCPWDAGALRAVVDRTLEAFTPVGAPATWVLSNHDVVRHRTRYGRAETGFAGADRRRLYGSAVDLALGERRARTAALLSLALPGGAYIYQGEELGLWEVEDLPPDVLKDPAWPRSGETRDGCRVPLPWSGSEPPFGFGPSRARPPWLPQPRDWAALSAERQSGDPNSMLELYRRALRLRRTHPALGDGGLRWAPDAPDGVLDFAREPGFRCVVNLSPVAVALPQGASVLLASAPLVRDLVPVDGAVWLG
jgi:alpha-glucosidase